jgi:hypothetical protein
VTREAADEARVVEQELPFDRRQPPLILRAERHDRLAPAATTICCGTSCSEGSV